MNFPAEHVLDHYRHPRHKMALPDPTITHEERNWSCGDALSIQLHIEEDHILDCGWAGEGCAVSQAAMSLLAETLPGMALEMVQQWHPQMIFDLLQIPVGTRRSKCALLCLHTLKNAICLYRNAPPLDWQETVGNAKTSG